jgi:F0F1-type ATP synthase membrane subunit b/b'
MNMDNNTKLELLAREYNATMEHAEKVLNEYVDTLIEQALLEANKIVEELENKIEQIILEEIEERERAKQIQKDEMLLMSALGMF